MVGALTHEHAGVDEQGRVVDAAHVQAGDPLADVDGEQPGEQRAVQRVEHQDAARPQDAARLGHRAAQVGHVLQQLAGADHGRTGVPQREAGDVGPDRLHLVHRGLDQRRGDQVDADMPVPLAVHVRGQESTAAAEVDQDVAGLGGVGYQPGTRGGQPVQHGEGAGRAPPFAGEGVILRQIVSPHPSKRGMNLLDPIDVR
jgi:hypothetical protein